MRFFKIVLGDYIQGCGKGNKGEQITESEYNEIMTAIQNHPQETETIGYRLKTDLTWESYEKEPEPEPDLDDSELVDILLGGES